MVHTSINLGNKVPVHTEKAITYNNVLNNVSSPTLLINITFNNYIQKKIIISLQLKI